jgi:plasmid stability protein
MAILQVRDIDDRLYDTLKQKAQIDNRSISQEVISILETYLSNPDIYNINSTREFLKLSWDDNRNADEIIDNLMKDRKNEKSFGEYNGVFDWKAMVHTPELAPELTTLGKIVNQSLDWGMGHRQYNKFPLQRRYPGACSWVLH